MGIHWDPCLWLYLTLPVTFTWHCLWPLLSTACDLLGTAYDLLGTACEVYPCQHGTCSDCITEHGAVGWDKVYDASGYTSLAQYLEGDVRRQHSGVRGLPYNTVTLATERYKHWLCISGDYFTHLLERDDYDAMKGKIVPKVFVQQCEKAEKYTLLLQI